MEDFICWRPNPRKVEQFINQSAHALCFALNHTQYTIAFDIEFGLEILLENPRITPDAPQWPAQVVGNG